MISDTGSRPDQDTKSVKSKASQQPQDNFLLASINSQDQSQFKKPQDVSIIKSVQGQQSPERPQSQDPAELLKIIEQLKTENAALKNQIQTLKF